MLITPVNQDDEAVSEAAEKIYMELKAAGVDVLIDDRDLRGGVKFKDADLIGIPIRVTVGKKSVAEGNVEVKLRTEAQSQKTPIGEASAAVMALIESLRNKLRGCEL